MSTRRTWTPAEMRALAKAGGTDISIGQMRGALAYAADVIESGAAIIAEYMAAEAPPQPADKRDAERLDWLSRQNFDELRFAIPVDRPHDGEYEVTTDGNGRVFYGPTLRAAIDAARTQGDQHATKGTRYEQRQ